MKRSLRLVDLWDTPQENAESLVAIRFHIQIFWMEWLPESQLESRLALVASLGFNNSPAKQSLLHLCFCDNLGSMGCKQCKQCLSLVPESSIISAVMFIHRWNTLLFANIPVASLFARIHQPVTFRCPIHHPSLAVT
jgi:hypothetical protein